MCDLRAGFVRLALQQGASLVPVLCLGELNTLRNFIDLPALQVRFQQSSRNRTDQMPAVTYPDQLPCSLSSHGCWLPLG